MIHKYLENWAADPTGNIVAMVLGAIAVFLLGVAFRRREP